jgi:hypothetical protein
MGTDDDADDDGCGGGVCKWTVTEGAMAADETDGADRFDVATMPDIPETDVFADL